MRQWFNIQGSCGFGLPNISAEERVGVTPMMPMDERNHGTARDDLTHLGRRTLLRAGGLGTIGLSLPAILRAEGQGPERRGTRLRPVRSCILIFYYGGPSHIDTWDPKPKAPREVRGQFNTIATRAPGIFLGEHLPRCAEVADRLAVIRSAHHPMTNHNAAAFATLCGRNPLKGDLELLASDRNDPPCLGGSMSHELPTRPGVPTAMALPHVMYNVVVLPGQSAGFLGSAHDPVQISADPNLPDFRLDELELPADVSLSRLDSRESMLRFVDDQARRAETRARVSTSTHDAYHGRALELLHSPRVRRAFDLSNEDPRTRDRYGRTKHGQSVLLARRLVEAGVRFVTVYDKSVNGQSENWDAHADVFNRLQNDLLPPADQALATLVRDLESRGLLEETLVVAMGEFGRTPRINGQSGRDHWPFVYSVVMAGGGVRGGTVYGSSDKLGAYPDADAVTPSDLAATLFWRFGLDPDAYLHDRTGRPYRLAEGIPLRSIFGA
ncbi:MAG: DUF1501 domain-containing protein [Isosphaeraceae bacterium]